MRMFENEWFYIYWRPMRRWAQDVIDELQIDVSEAGHLAYDQAIFREALWSYNFATDILQNELFLYIYILESL
jgi:hypothetical protein